MSSRSTIAFVAAVMPCLSYAQGALSYECTFGSLQRRIEILTEPGVSVPCEVHYYKDNEAPGERQVLWSAASELGYCERRTEEFIAKLEGWGWTCEEADDSVPVQEHDMPAEGSEPDDTETLAPADETEGGAEA